jgi:hypothetical protein
MDPSTRTTSTAQSNDQSSNALCKCEQENITVSWTQKFVSNFYAYKRCVGGSAWMNVQTINNVSVDAAKRIFAALPVRIQSSTKLKVYEFYQVDLDRKPKLLPYKQEEITPETSREDVAKRVEDYARFQLTTAYPDPDRPPRIFDLKVECKKKEILPSYKGNSIHDSIGSSYTQTIVVNDPNLFQKTSQQLSMELSHEFAKMSANCKKSNAEKIQEGMTLVEAFNKIEELTNHLSGEKK